MSTTPISPDSLEEETPPERRARERQTGVLGTGLTVICYPTDDPAVFETKHRVACLAYPIPNCRTCPHSSFELIFRSDTAVRKMERVACPRWSQDSEHPKEAPEAYLLTPVATCMESPFWFCRQCPSQQDLQELGLNKSEEGWYPRWVRFSKEDDHD